MRSDPSCHTRSAHRLNHNTQFCFAGYFPGSTLADIRHARTAGYRMVWLARAASGRCQALDAPLPRAPPPYEPLTHVPLFPAPLLHAPLLHAPVLHAPLLPAEYSQVRLFRMRGCPQVAGRSGTTAVIVLYGPPARRNPISNKRARRRFGPAQLP